MVANRVRQRGLDVWAIKTEHRVQGTAICFTGFWQNEAIGPAAYQLGPEKEFLEPDQISRLVDCCHPALTLPERIFLGELYEARFPKRSWVTRPDLDDAAVAARLPLPKRPE